jgi:hypothetical protein
LADPGHSRYHSGDPPRANKSDRSKLRNPEAAKLIYKPLPQDDPRQRQPDLAKAKALVALADGLKETIAYFKHSLEL